MLVYAEGSWFGHEAVYWHDSRFVTHSDSVDARANAWRKQLDVAMGTWYNSEVWNPTEISLSELLILSIWLTHFVKLWRLFDVAGWDLIRWIPKHWKGWRVPNSERGKRRSHRQKYMHICTYMHTVFMGCICAQTPMSASGSFHLVQLFFYHTQAILRILGNTIPALNATSSDCLHKQQVASLSQLTLRREPV